MAAGRRRRRHGSVLLAALVALQWLLGVDCGGIDPSDASPSIHSMAEEDVATAAILEDPDAETDDEVRTAGASLPKEPQGEAMAQEGVEDADSTGDASEKLGLDPLDEAARGGEGRSNDGSGDQAHEGTSTQHAPVDDDEGSDRSSDESVHEKEQSLHETPGLEQSQDNSDLPVDEIEPPDAVKDMDDASGGDRESMDHPVLRDDSLVDDISQDRSDESEASGDDSSIDDTTTENRQSRSDSTDPDAAVTDSVSVETTMHDASQSDTAEPASSSDDDTIDLRTVDDTTEAGVDAETSPSGADSPPRCGVWGTHQSRRSYNISLLYDFFQLDVLGNKTEFQFTDPKLEATKITNAAFGQARRDDTAVSEKPTNEFVDGLDDIDKFFEGVEPPDELDVGAGSSIQEVLMGQGSRIVIKRLKMGFDFVSQALGKTKHKVMEKIQANVTKLRMPDKERLADAGHWIAEQSVRLFQATRHFVDNVFEGNFESLFDTFGSDDEDFSFDYDSPLITTAEATPTTDPSSDSRNVASSASRTDRTGAPTAAAEQEMKELLRLMNLKSDSSVGSASQTGPTASDQKQAADQEMNDLLRQLGL